MNPTGTWNTPHQDDQFSHVIPQDTDACVSYATVHSIESQLKFLGVDDQFSERALAAGDGTTLAGNSITKVFDWVKDHGLIENTLWPEPPTFTWAQYYEPVPQNIVDTGQDFLRRYGVSFRYNIPASEVSDALKVAPVLAFIPEAGTSHCVEVYKEGYYFDSYPHGGTGTVSDYQVPFTEASSYHQIVITPKMNPNVILFLYNGIVYPAVPLATENPAEVSAFNRIFGTDITVNGDGSIPGVKPVVDKT